MKKKICIVVNSRANYARIKSVLKAVKKHPELELKLVVGASALLQKFGELTKIISKDGFKISAKLLGFHEKNWARSNPRLKSNKFLNFQII